MSARYVLFFDEISKNSLAQVGGKGANLGELSQAGFPVPGGYCVTTAAFREFLEQNGLAAFIAATLAEATPENPSQVGAKLRAKLQQAAMPEAVAQEIVRAWEQTGSEKAFAVRSSATAEDLAFASFAGQQDTYLNIRGEPALLAAVRECWASLFTDRAILYREQNGVDHTQVSMAVVVQQLVAADSAGVAFSLNPLNNCYDEAVLNANYGLGESVVSGVAEPDVFVVDKIQRVILETRVGRKQAMVILKPEGGIATASCAAGSATSITPAQALELTGLLERVEAHYQTPIDMEWAITAGKIYLLQARPITAYLPLPPEMLTAPGQPKRLYANSTLIEQGLQEPLSVLGTDFLAHVLNKVGGPVAEGAIGPDGIAFTAGGGYYMNISHARMLGMKNASLAPGSIGDPRVTEILNGIVMKQYTGGELPAKMKAMRGQMVFKMLPMATGVLEAYFRPVHVLQKYQAALPEEIRRLETFSAKGRSLQAQAAALTDLLAFFYGDYGIPMILSAQLAQQRIQGLFKQEAAQVKDHLINLGIALPGNKTTEMGEAMYALASSPELKRFATAVDFLSALESGSVAPEFVRRWEHFLAEFGFRCPGEIDPATPRPSERPAQFFEQLKNMSLSVNGSRSFFDEARAKREAAYQALYDIALKKGKNQARAFDRFYKRWLTFGGYRETPKHYTVKVVDLFRKQALAIAQTFVAAKRLDRPDQIFDLTITDIDRAQTDSALDLRALASERSALINKIRKNKRVARIIDSRGKIYYPPRKAAADGEFSGVPISPGVVQGRARVLHSASEKKLLPGEILIARATDPGWTPLFINARGIILEIGGALQHGAVVAREYGIPCVSGVDDATSQVKDGQLVEVDGSNGIVRLLDDR